MGWVVSIPVFCDSGFVILDPIRKARVSIPALIGAIIFARFIGKSVKSKEDIDIDAVAKSYEEIVAGYGPLPNGCISLAPIVVPILLITAHAGTLAAIGAGAMAGIFVLSLIIR
jgi:GntP family gluconate:H+ symporter